MQKTQLLLLPGLMCDANAWEHQIAHLEDDAEIVVADLSMARTPAEMVEAALVTAPAKFALAGHSMGGWVALEIMRHAPERVTKLCLANTTAALDTPEKTQARKEMLQQAEQGDYEAIIERLASTFVHNKEFLEPVKDMLRHNEFAFINQEAAMLARQDCVSLLHTIKCPTVVIHASHDQVFSIDDSQQLANKIVNSHLHTIEDSGHMSLMEKANEFTQIMRHWLFNS